MLLPLLQNLGMFGGPALNPPIITTNSLPDAIDGVAYSQQLAAAGLLPITWTLFSGALPTGLSLSSTGLISGTTAVIGTANFVVRATNADGTDDQALSILVQPAGAGAGTLCGLRLRWWKRL